MSTVHLKQYPDTRPKTRGECSDMPRPCPFLSCRYHLAHEWADPYYGKAPSDDELLERMTTAPHSCSLDAADVGGMSVDEVSKVAGISYKAVINETYRARKMARKSVKGGSSDILDNLNEDKSEPFDLWAPSPGITMKGVDF